jgi:hypothetical protein
MVEKRLATLKRFYGRHIFKVLTAIIIVAQAITAQEINTQELDLFELEEEPKVIYTRKDFAENAMSPAYLSELAYARSQLNHYNKMKQAGTGLLIAGTTTMGIDFVGLFIVPALLALPIFTNGSDWFWTERHARTSMVIWFSGALMTGGGITLRIAGKNNVKRYSDNVWTAHIRPNGFNLVYNF